MADNAARRYKKTASAIGGKGSCKGEGSPAVMGMQNVACVFFLTGSSSTLCKFRFYTVWIRDPRKSRCHLPRPQIHADRFTYVDLRSTYVDPGTTQVAILPDNSLYTSCEALKCTLMVLPTLDFIMEGYSGAMI
jgi:hypothetical protein